MTTTIEEAVNALDLYLNAGCKQSRKRASIEAQKVSEKYQNRPYSNNDSDMIIKREELPKWAKYHVINCDGQGYAMNWRPIRDDTSWLVDLSSKMVKTRRFNLKGINWKETLEIRPENKQQ